MTEQEASLMVFKPTRNAEGKLVISHEDLYRGIDQLGECAAQGTPGAATILLMLAFRSVLSLAYVAERNPDSLRGSAKNFCFWPILFGHHPATQRQAKELITKLGISKNYSRDPFMPDAKNTHANDVTWGLIAWIEQIRETGCLLPDQSCPPRLLKKIRKLPPLSTAVCKQWYEALRLLVDSATERHPERQLRLRLLGIGKETHKSDLYPPGTKTAESNIRAEIYARFRRALEQIAKKQGAQRIASARYLNRVDNFASSMFRTFPDIPPASIRGELLKILDAESRGEKSQSHSRS